MEPEIALNLELSADYTDYADYVCGSDVVREDQNAHPSKPDFFALPRCTTLNRNLRNLCNLRIFNLGLSSADRC
jgi:hypothetical protein